MNKDTFKPGKAFINSGYFPAVVLGLAFAALLAKSWFKWGDPIIDTGRELYVPARLAEGKVLYRDVFYLYGPLSPYLNALLYKFLGVRILSLVLGGIATAAGTGLVIYKISRFFLGIHYATFIAFVFLSVFAFQNFYPVGIFNFILPYSYSATQATLCAMASLYLMFIYWKDHRLHAGLLAGFSTFLCMACRIEIGCMMMAAVAAGAVALKLGERKLSGSIRIVRPLLLLPLVLTCCLYGFVILIAGSKIAHSNLGGVFLSNVNFNAPFTQSMAGLYDAGGNLRRIGFSLGSYALLGGWFLSAGALMNLLRNIGGTRFRIVLQGVVGIAASCGAFFYVRHWFTADLQYRCLPLFLLFMAGLSGFRYLRYGRDTNNIRDLILFVFGFFMLMRISLNTSSTYGFYLLVPGLIGYHLIFFKTAPELIRNRFMRITWQAGFFAVLLLFCFENISRSYSMYSKRTLSIPSSVGTLSFCNTIREQGSAELVKFLALHLAPNDEVVVFPEGLTFNFFAQRINPLYYYSYLPLDFNRPEVSETIIQELQSKKVPYVVLVQRPVNEYGSRGFGVDYAQDVYTYITTNYSELAEYGPIPPVSSNFSFLILKRQ